MKEELKRILEDIEYEVKESFENGEMSYESRNEINNLISRANSILDDLKNNQ
jgi:hypothetical protein